MMCDILISIHALREEGDWIFDGLKCTLKRFLSTPSARRATPKPEPPPSTKHISIHALREEGDARTTRRSCRTLYFYPRPPRGGRRGRSGSGTGQRPISIHALREEGDRPRHGRGGGGWHFYPRPPRGGRREQIEYQLSIKRFLSTPSARRATRCVHQAARPSAISIHALREEGDGQLDKAGVNTDISIHALREEGDSQSWKRCSSTTRFLSTPSARRATHPDQRKGQVRSISIHARRVVGDASLL